jgi:phospholipid transport system transporter-binding protein
MKDMILRDGNRLIVSGAVTIENVVKLTELGSAMLNQEDWVIDMQQVTEVDSSAVSMLLEWHRRAHRQNGQIQFTNLPEALKSLAQLYGVSELIPMG